MIEGATYETSIADGIALYDVSHLLPEHPHKTYGPRTSPMRALFVHHSGNDTGRDGLAALLPMANWHVLHHKWAAMAYHFAITKRPLRDEDGNLVMLRVGGDRTVRSHTGLCNRFSEGLVLQGNTSKSPMSDFQMECLEGFIPWWMAMHELTPAKALGWHSIAHRWLGRPKRWCPGADAVAWLEQYKERA